MFVVGLLAFDTDIFCLEHLGDIIPQSTIDGLRSYCMEEPLVAIPGEWESPWQAISWIVWGIFAIDVSLKYRAVRNWKVFLRRHWFDLLLLIPFFRIMKILRILRLLQTAKAARAYKMIKLVKEIRNYFRAYKKTKRFVPRD